MHREKRSQIGFTLIEMSIVLVIIGLIVGGVLVGQDLIHAAAVRATVAQIEKYSTAVNTFREKYGALPGDLNAATASQFGFSPRGTSAGQGDGNGLLQGSARTGRGASGTISMAGESAIFWEDLSYANGQNINLIEGSFNPPAYAGNAWQSVATLLFTPAATDVGLYIPEAKIGHGNFVYVWSGGPESIWNSVVDNTNYFALAKTTGLAGVSGGSGTWYTDMGLTAKEAYDIDKKVDDGLPQSGRVTATFMNGWASALAGATAGLQSIGLADSTTYGVVTNPLAVLGETASTNTCYDLIRPGTLPLVYSIGGNVSPNNSNQVNCALSFQFQ